MKQLTESLEDYLEMVWVLSLRKGVVRVKDLAANLKVSSASATTAVKNLAILNLVEHEKYGHIRLTDEGLEQAQDVYERHVALNRFFTGILGVDQAIAENDACEVEHHLSRDTFNRLLRFIHLLEQHRNQLTWLSDLENANLDTSDVTLPAHIVTLKDYRPGDSGVVQRILAQGRVKRRLLDMGVLPGESIHLIKLAPLGDPLEILIKGYRLSLRREEAAAVQMKAKAIL
ncbi:MAG: DtxR family transcriptional regulator [Candidatus Delongbacteria bacterium]|nr:DtxR family transcriptional regulator [bacterium]MBL7032560.1 DtxR family transcriptional regulator [Candidatus Delongbacteria bacterium]